MWWESWDTGGIGQEVLPWALTDSSHTRLLTQAHLSNALDPLTSQLCALQPKQVQPLSFCVHLKGVLKTVDTQARIQAHSTQHCPLTHHTALVTTLPLAPYEVGEKP